MPNAFTFTILLSCIIIAISAEVPEEDFFPFLQCKKWCLEHSLGLIDCEVPALFQTGPCYECGPFKKNPAEELCNSHCVDTSKDKDNCGECENQCIDGQTCQSGTCACSNGQPLCGTGSSATCCIDGQTCQSGTCACPNGQPLCGTGDTATCCQDGQECSNSICIQPCAFGSSCAVGAVGCPNSDSCRCITTAEGKNVCAGLINFSPCEPPCSQSSDCPPGYACAVNLCCQPGACVRVSNFPSCH